MEEYIQYKWKRKQDTLSPQNKEELQARILCEVPYKFIAVVLDRQEKDIPRFGWLELFSLISNAGEKMTFLQMQKYYELALVE